MSMDEKIIHVVSPSMPPFEEFTKEIYSIWETKQLTNSGPKHALFQRKLEEFLNVKHVSLFANGHLALEAGIQALDLKGEVITTPFTFVSTTQAILRCGLTPVFCDISTDDYTIDASKIEALITENTSAILPVHVYGNICNDEMIEKIAKKHNLKVIYDAAHAFGETYKGRNVAELGDMSMFSFHATKVFNSVEGGCLAFSDDTKEDVLNSLKQFGQMAHTDSVPYVGTNAKMSELHAAMGLLNLKYLSTYIEKRKKVVSLYRDRLSQAQGIRLCKEKAEVIYNYSYFPVLIDADASGTTRDIVCQKLQQNNIYARKYFYPLTSDLECCRKRNIDAYVPVAKYVSDSILTLPCYSDLELDDVDKICDIILQEIQG